VKLWCLISSVTATIIIVVIVIIVIVVIVSCRMPFLPGTSLEPMVIPTAQAASLTVVLSILCVMFQV
jgi:hypothetical protein